MQIAIQTMAETQSRVEETQWGPKIGGPVLKQPQFNWDAADKYSEWKAFILEVKNVLSTYNTPQHDKIAIEKKLVRQKGVALYWEDNRSRKAGMQHPPRVIWHISNYILAAV